MLRCLFAVCVALGMCLAPSPAGAAGSYAQSSSITPVSPNFVELVRREGATVVNISARRTAQGGDERDWPELDPGTPTPEILRRLLPPDPTEFNRLNVGSGFVISEDGYILTNAHLVAQISEPTVTLSDRRKFKARVVGMDLYTDVALIKIDASGLKKVRIGATSLEVGEWVAAIGSPFGFANSVTAGIVSAIHRHLPNEGLIPFIQTDVAVNPGNSGGPLFNLLGEVVGINSMIYSAHGGYMGVSFAVPIGIAMSVAGELRAHGKVTRGSLGMRTQDMTPELAASFGLSDVAGALVVAVEKGGPADEAGFRPGDVILSMHGKAIRSSGELLLAVARMPPGARVELEVWRRGAPTRLTAIMGELGRREAAVPRQLQESRVDRMGLTLIELTARERQELETEGALLVRSVSGPARIAGIRPGDVILAAGDAKVERIADLNAAISAHAPGNVMALLVIRDEGRAYIAVRLAD